MVKENLGGVKKYIEQSAVKPYEGISSELPIAYKGASPREFAPRLHSDKE